MADILSAFEFLIQDGSLSCEDRVDLPAQSERSVPIPDSYRSGSVGRWLENDEKLKGNLWFHQAKAMEAAAQGRNVVIATGTASGKSLIFQSIALSALDKSSESTAIIFYPMKALAADQFVSWSRVAKIAGLSGDSIVKIDGSVPRGERAELLENARIALMTPDICHAWLLNEVSKPAHRDFLARVSLIIIDEAHVLESVFGSNFAYLFRRLCAARSLVSSKQKLNPLQVIAASATILEPEKHLSKLTGFDFDAIGEKDDGAPRNARSVVHLCATDKEETKIATSLMKNLVEGSNSGSFVTFIDSRQGAERLAVEVDYPDLVKPYRSGFENKDRANIEETLRSGNLRGVVSTSALELGIDIPHFAVGFNVNVPASRKSFRQRLGRVGRHRPGNFGILAEPYAFKRFGMTLEDYYEASVEPSYLYLHNRFMQYAHARCLSEELDMLGVTGKKTAPSVAPWPEGFSDVFDFAYVGSPSVRPREFDSIRNIGGDAPHWNYPLRNGVEESFNIIHKKGGSVTNPNRVGTLNLQQAIHEGYPGAIYLHMGKKWRVYEWQNTSFERTVRVSPVKFPMLTKPVIRTFVNFSLERDGLIEGHFRKSDCGILAECQLQIIERVEGYRVGAERKLYRDLRADNSGMTPKTRDIRTTGVVLQINGDWFQRAGVKQRFADALRELLQREYSISPQDVDCVATNVSLVRNGERQPVSNVIVVFDATNGSLRLTEAAYLEFGHLIDQIEHSMDMTPPDQGILSPDEVVELREWFEALGGENKMGLDSIESPEYPGWIKVFEVGSVVMRRDTKGVFEDIEIVGYEFFVDGDEPQLCYRYKAKDTNVKALTPAGRIEAAADECKIVYWNPETNETSESPGGAV